MIEPDNNYLKFQTAITAYLIRHKYYYRSMFYSDTTLFKTLSRVPLVPLCCKIVYMICLSPEREWIRFISKHSSKSRDSLCNVYAALSALKITENTNELFRYILMTVDNHRNSATVRNRLQPMTSKYELVVRIH
jgi:hypothetical protein